MWSVSRLGLLFLLWSLPALADVHWLPVQGRVGARGSLHTSGEGEFGLDLQLAGVLGGPGSGNGSFAMGPFWGLGAGAFFGAADTALCSSLCAERQVFTFGPRIGLAWADDAGDWVWPDAYIWAQVSGVVAREALPSAPLRLAGSQVTGGARLEIGFTALEWTRTMFNNGGRVSGGSSGSVAVSLMLLMLGLINSASFTFEYTAPGITTGGLRFGITLAVGF